MPSDFFLTYQPPLPSLINMSSFTESLRSWCDSASYTIESDYIPLIHRALHDYCSDRSDLTTKARLKIASTVISHLTTQNAIVERWPYPVRCYINRDRKTPFKTHAEPAGLEYRVQAVAVWHNLLLFLSFHWKGYGNDFYFERIGLCLPDDVKEILDDITFYSSRQGVRALKEKTLEFMFICILDPKPTVSTNPLLWWIAVIALTEDRKSVV